MPTLLRRISDRLRWELREWRSPSRPAFIHEELDRAILEDVAWPAAGRILDVGCGLGEYMQVLTRRGLSVFGIDINRLALRVAAVGGNQVIAADAMRLPFANETFDGLLCHKTLYLFTDMPAAAAELARVIRPGGRLVFSTSNPASFYARVQRLATAAGRNHNWHRCNAWSVPHWCRAFAAHGFSVAAVYSCNVVWPIVFRVCDRWLIPNEWMRRYNRLIRRVSGIPTRGDRPLSAAMDYVVELIKQPAPRNISRLPVASALSLPAVVGGRQEHHLRPLAGAPPDEETPRATQP